MAPFDLTLEVMAAQVVAVERSPAESVDCRSVRARTDVQGELTGTSRRGSVRVRTGPLLGQAKRAAVHDAGQRRFTSRSSRRVEPLTGCIIWTARQINSRQIPPKPQENGPSSGTGGQG